MRVDIADPGIAVEDVGRPTGAHRAAASAAKKPCVEEEAKGALRVAELMERCARLVPGLRVHEGAGEIERWNERQHCSSTPRQYGDQEPQDAKQREERACCCWKMMFA